MAKFKLSIPALNLTDLEIELTEVVVPVDTDGDGIPDSEDQYPNDPTNTPPPVDTDGDGIPDSEDAYPNDPTNTPPPVDTDGDGIPDSEDPYPNDPTNTPPADGNSHFESLLSNSNTVASYSLRDPAQYDLYNAGNSNPVVRVTYDEVKDAAKIVLYPGENSLNLSDIPVLPMNGNWNKLSGVNEVSFQIEFMRDAEWLNALQYGWTNHKFIRGDNKMAGGDRRRFELQTRYSPITGVVAVPTLRTYTATVSESNDPITYGGNWQPGPDCEYKGSLTYTVADHGQPGKPFFILPNVWVRMTMSLRFVDGVQYLRVWMSDENTDPKLIVTDPANRDLGTAVETTLELSGLSSVEIAYNTSQTGTTAPSDMLSWFRNCVVMTNQTVPLGGRPVA